MRTKFHTFLFFTIFSYKNKPIYVCTVTATPFLRMFNETVADLQENDTHQQIPFFVSKYFSQFPCYIIMYYKSCFEVRSLGMTDTK